MIAEELLTFHYKDSSTKAQNSKLLRLLSSYLNMICHAFICHCTIDYEAVTRARIEQMHGECAWHLIEHSTQVQ